MRPGGEERHPLLFRVGYGVLFVTIGAGLLLRAYSVGAPETITTLDLMACGATGVCFALAGIALLTHDPRDDACVNTTSGPPDGAARQASDRPIARGVPPVPCRAGGAPRYRDVARPARPRPRRDAARRLPSHP